MSDNVHIHRRSYEVLVPEGHSRSLKVIQSSLSLDDQQTSLIVEIGEESELGQVIRIIVSS